MSWRYWLIDLPSHATDIGLAWYRLLFFALLVCAAAASVTGLLGVVLAVVLWFGFGIRWGW